MSSYNETTFENIKHYTDENIEFWYARELQEVLQYKRWDKFSNIIQKAKIACESSGNTVVEHFSHVGKTIAMPKGASKEIDDFMLSFKIKAIKDCMVALVQKIFMLEKN